MLEEQKIDVAGMCPRYYRTYMKISLQKKMRSKQMTAKPSGALIKLFYFGHLGNLLKSTAAGEMAYWAKC